jgi:hypothetical protein
MRLCGYEQNRVLIKDNGSCVSVENNAIVEYTGIYYRQSKSFENIYATINFERQFIGCVECHRSNEDRTTGIYIKPLYILIDEKWYKIKNYQSPRYKYFLYPHLLMLPGEYYHYKPIYTLDSIKNISLNGLDAGTIELEYYG